MKWWPSQRHGLRDCLAAVFVASLLLPTQLRADAPSYRELTLEIPLERSGLLFARFDADERLDLLTADDSVFRLQLQEPSGRFGKPIELDAGREFGGALFDRIDVDGDGIQELALLHETGIDVFAYDGESRAWKRREPAILTKQRGIRFLHLASQNFVEDLDGDGDDDFVYPVDGRIYLYTNQGGVWERSGEIETEPTQVDSSVAPLSLSGLARTRVRVPRLGIERSSRADSRVEIRLPDGRYVRSRDGTSALSGEYVVERAGDDPLERFKRRHGIVLKENETLQAILRDLDQDGINDYTIVFKNRIWVYRGKSDGFDFDAAPDQLVKVSAADRVSVLLLPLDGDGRPDLVLFKYRIPSLARLVAALAVGLRSEIEVLGYFNDQKPVFSRSPSKRSKLVVRVPPLLQLVGEVEDIVDRFQDILRPMQGVTSGDFNGDARDDVLRLAGEQLEIYFTREGEPTPIDLAEARGRDFLQQYQGHELVQRVLFEQPRREVTIESAMQLAGDVVTALQTSIVGEREPELRIPVEREAAERVDQILAQDLDGDGQDDILVYLEPDRELQRKEGRRPESQTLQLWLSAGPQP